MKTKYRRILWLISSILFVTLLIKMANLPSAYGFWFPFILSFIICGIGVSIVGAILAAFLQPILKKYTFWTLFAVVSSIITIGLHIYIYSPPLKIIVPDNFVGEINLVVHPKNEKNLKINSNGTGYITESIYLSSSGNKKPNVYFKNGERVSPKRIIGYDSLFFYDRRNFNGQNALNFKIKKK
nr:hypothetical protein [Allomuricauda sp.]